MELKISKSNRTCAACGNEFTHEQDIFSVVRVEEGELVRADFCTSCVLDEHTANAYCSWASRYYDPKAAEQEEPEVFSPLRQAFYESLDSTDRVEMAKAFLAAQLLRRQRVFRLIKESDSPEGEERVALFSDRIGNRLVEVRDPSLSHAELEDGRHRLMERLQALEAPEELDESPDGANTTDEAPAHAATS